MNKHMFRATNELAYVLDGNLDVKPIYRDIQVLLVRIIVARVGVGVFRGRIVSRLRRAIARLRVGIRRAVARLRRVAAGLRGVTRSDGELHCLGEQRSALKKSKSKSTYLGRFC